MQRLFVWHIAGETAAVCGGGRWIRYRGSGLGFVSGFRGNDREIAALRSQ
jgi:hypothetical protein